MIRRRVLLAVPLAAAPAPGHAQGLAPFDAASCGAFLLGSSADTALDLLKERMLLARDVIGAIEQTVESF